MNEYKARGQASYEAARGLINVLEEGKIPVRVSLTYRARPWLEERQLSYKDDGWFLTEDQEWKDIHLWKAYDEPRNRIIIDYHRSKAFTGLRDPSPQALPFVQRWKALGYQVQEVDGEDQERIKELLQEKESGQVVIVHTKIGL